MIKLLGIVIVAVGLAFRWNTLAVVLAAGLVSGMLAGFSFHEVVAMTGGFFVDNRGLLLPVIMMVPVVGVLERHGLQQRVAELIRRSRAATAARVLWLYQTVRGASSVLGINIGNHASMIRPLIVPMAEAAAVKDMVGFHSLQAALPAEAAAVRDAQRPLSHDAALPAEAAAGCDPQRTLSPAARNDLRAHAAASENVGNFFSDDILVAVGALLLIDAFFRNAGVEVRLRDIQLWSLPTAAWVLLVGAWRYQRLERRLRGAGSAERPSGRKEP